MHVTTCIFLLRVIDKRMHIARHRPIAAGGVRVEPTARLHRKVSGLLHRFHREIAGRLDDDRSLAAHPGDNGRPGFVVMPSLGLAPLAATSRAASQTCLSARWRFSLLPSRVIEVI